MRAIVHYTKAKQRKFAPIFLFILDFFIETDECKKTLRNVLVIEISMYHFYERIFLDPLLYTQRIVPSGSWVHFGYTPNVSMTRC